MTPETSKPTSSGPESIVDRIEATLEAIDSDRHRAFVTIDRDGALAAAHSAERRRLAGESLGPLDGVAVGLKDNVDTAGVRTSLGSRLFADRIPGGDAEVVVRLKAAGAVVVGKTNMTELACGTTGANPWSGDVLNPLDVSRSPGGSSSGSAAAVAAALVPVAIGTDTACSIRQPAAMCGVVGFKPTYGRVSVEGVGVNARTLDHVGPLTATTVDAAATLAAIQSSGWNDPSGLLGRPTSSLRVGVLGGEFIDTCRPDVARCFEQSMAIVRKLAEAGTLGTVSEIDLALALATIDEHANVLGKDLFDVYGDAIRAASPGEIGEELRSWLDLYDAIDPARCTEALSVQASITERIEAALADYDVVLCPTTRSTAAAVTDVESEPREQRVLNCSIWSLTGQPSLSLPFGRSTPTLPGGLLITGHRGRDDIVLQVAFLLEQHRPALSPS